MRAGGHLRGILDGFLLAVGEMHDVFHVGNRGDELEVELAFEAFSHDVHVQQAQKAAAKPKPQRHGRFWFIMQRTIVELQLFERIAKLFVPYALGGIQAGKDH